MLSPSIHPTARSSRRRSAPAAWAGAALACAVVVMACKPAEERPRHPSAADAGPTGVVTTHAPLERPPGAVLVAPLPEDAAPPPMIGEAEAPRPAADAAGADEDTGGAAADAATADTAMEDADAAADATGDLGDDPTVEDLGGVTLAPELLARVRAPADEPDQQRARALNASGLRKHRRFDLDDAIRDYARALDAWPGHHFSNYNLACAHALERRPDDALRHLAILRAIGDETARERLLAARANPDFETMRDNPRFRALTGYAPVQVTWSPSAERERATAGRLASALREAKIPATSAVSAWTTDERDPVLLVREGDPVAADMAREVAQVVRLEGLQTRTSTAPTHEAPVVLVLPGDAEVAVTTRDAPKTLSDYLGVRLTARDTDGTLSTLHLKETGFFDWVRSEPDGRRIQRRGRYTIRGDILAVTFDELVEAAPGAEPSAGAVEKREDVEATHALRATEEGLFVDGLKFTGGGG